MISSYGFECRHEWLRRRESFGVSWQPLTTSKPRSSLGFCHLSGDWNRGPEKHQQPRTFTFEGVSSLEVPENNSKRVRANQVGEHL